jgi:hypothetical protein
MSLLSQLQADTRVISTCYPTDQLMHRVSDRFVQQPPRKGRLSPRQQFVRHSDAAGGRACRALQGRCNRRRDARVAGKAGELDGSGSRPYSRTSQVPQAGSLRLAHPSRCRGSMSIAATSVATGITWRSRETPSAASVPADASPSTTAPMNRTARPRLERRSRRSRIVGTVNLSAGHQG